MELEIKTHCFLKKKKKKLIFFTGVLLVLSLFNDGHKDIFVY